MPRQPAIEIDLDEGTPQPRTPLERLERDLAQALVAEGLATEAELEEARNRQHRVGGRLSTCLWELGLVDAVSLRQAGARAAGVPGAVPADVARAPDAVLRLLDPDFVAEYRVIPFARHRETLLVATAEPWRLPLLDSIGDRAGCRVEARFLDEAPLGVLLGELYGLNVDARFAKEPPPKARPAPAPRAAPVPASDAGPFGGAGELMSETAFDAIYRGGDAPAVEDPSSTSDPGVSATGPDAATEPRAEGLAAAEAAPHALPAPDADPVLDLVEAESAWESTLDPARATPLGELQRARESLALVADRHQLGWVLCRFARARAARVVLLLRRADVWMGWTGAGDGVSAERVEALVLPPQPGTIFGDVEASRAPYLGPLADHPLHRRFVSVLGGGAPPERVGFVPVLHRERMILAIYVDAGPAGALGDDLAELVALARDVRPALERLALARKRAPSVS